MSGLRVRASVALIGEDLEPARDVCIEVDDSGFISRVSRPPCQGEALRASAALPLSANAHIHSADSLFPEHGYSMSIEELVAPPSGLKHRLLASASRRDVVEATASTYRAAEAMGVGLIADYREPAAGGCLTGREAAEKSYGVARIIVLGRPGDPGGPGTCDGTGLNSPLDYPEGLPDGWSSLPIQSAHVAETRDMRSKGDFEAAMKLGFSVIVHGVHLTRRDLEEAAAEGLWLVLCPRSNMWHSTGVPPVKTIIEMGVNTAFGTDNAAWTPPDPAGEAATAVYIARLQGVKGEEAAGWALKALYRGGYEAYRVEPPAIEESREASLTLYLTPQEGSVYTAKSLRYAIVKRVLAERPVAVVRGSICLSWPRGVTPCRAPGLLSS